MCDFLLIQVFKNMQLNFHVQHILNVQDRLEKKTLNNPQSIPPVVFPSGVTIGRNRIFLSQQLFRIRKRSKAIQVNKNHGAALMPLYLLPHQLELIPYRFFFNNASVSPGNF